MHTYKLACNSWGSVDALKPMGGPQLKSSWLEAGKNKTEKMDQDASQRKGTAVSSTSPHKERHEQLVSKSFQECKPPLKTCRHKWRRCWRMRTGKHRGWRAQGRPGDDDSERSRLPTSPGTEGHFRLVFNSVGSSASLGSCWFDAYFISKS